MKTLYTKTSKWSAGVLTLCTAFVMLCCATANAQTVYGPFASSPALDMSGLDGAYTGNPATMSSDAITVSGVTGTYVLDMSVDVAIQHTWIGDLTLKLVSPDGDTLTLMSRAGLAETVDGAGECCGTGSDWTGETVTFIDGGATDAELMVGPPSGTYFPSPGITAYPTQDFASLLGGTLNGTWTLYLGDGAAGDPGTLDSWSISITTASPSFTLEKTVGLEPDPSGNGCQALPIPTTDYLGVNAGDSVCYWYTLTNTGDVDFDLMDFADDQLFPTGFTNTPGFDLTVGSSLSVVWSDTPTEITSEVTNIVNITYHNSTYGISASEQTDNATVGIIPDNDECSNAVTLSCGVPVVGTNAFATGTGNNANQDCGELSGDTPVWYTFVGTGNDMELTTCGSTTDAAIDFAFITVYDGSCGGSTFNCVANNGISATDPDCGSNNSQILTFPTTAGTTYFVAVTGYSGVGAIDFDLTLNCLPPANDDVCDAAALSIGSNGPFYNETATVEGGEPVPGAGTGGSSCQSQDGWCSFELGLDNTTWYSFVAPASGSVTISTDASGFDTQLALYSAAACADVLAGGATLLGANDDNPNYITTQFSSELTVSCLTPGETYFVQVDGYAGAFGALLIELTDNGGVAVSATVSGGGVACDGGTVDVQVDFTGTGPWDVIVDVDGNQFPQAGLSSPTVLPTSSAGTYTIVFVTDQGTGCSTAGTGSAVVTTGDSPVAGLSSAQVGGSLDVDFTDMSTGGAPTGWFWDFGDGNTSTSQNPTHTYAAPGDYGVCLTVTNDCGVDSACDATVSVVPSNDLCADAEAIACGQTVSGTTENGTSQGADLGTCGTSLNTSAPGVWYTFVGDGSLVTLSTCDQADFDTKIGLFSGSCGSLTCVAGNDDGTGCSGFSSLLEDVLTTNGETYYVYVTGFDNTEFGAFDLTMTCTTPPPPPVNDNVCDAIALSMGANGPFNTDNASVEGGEPVPPAGSNGCESQDGWCNIGGEPNLDGTTWYSFVAPASGTVTVNTDNSYDTQIAVYEAAACADVTGGGATLLGANDDNPNYITTQLSSEVTVCGLTPGATYFVQVDGYAGASGDLNIELSEPLIADWTSVALNATVDFTDNSSASGTIVSWDWTFGDGGTSTDQNPSHTFPGDGTYTVCLTVTDDNGCTSTYCNDVVILVISVAEALESGMTVYPNPSNGEFVVEVRGVEGAARITVMDVTGRQVYSQGAVLNGDFRKNINLDVAKGSYLLQIATDEAIVTRKIQID